MPAHSGPRGCQRNPHFVATMPGLAYSQPKGSSRQKRALLTATSDVPQRNSNGPDSSAHFRSHSRTRMLVAMHHVSARPLTPSRSASWTGIRLTHLEAQLSRRHFVLTAASGLAGDVDHADLLSNSRAIRADIPFRRDACLNEARRRTLSFNIAADNAPLFDKG